MFQGDASHLPLKLNIVGRHPADLRLLAAAAADHGRAVHAPGQGREWLTRSSPSLGPRPAAATSLLYVALIVFFAFFYTAIVFNPKETADNLQQVRRLPARHPPGRARRPSTSTTC